MGTRGCVAVGTSEMWKGGRFVRKYGTALPMAVWDIVAVPGGVERFQELVRDHEAGFFVFPDQCYCHLPDEHAKAPFPDELNHPKIRLSRAKAAKIGVEIACVLEVATRMLHIFVLDNASERLELIHSAPVGGSEPDWGKFLPC